HIHLGKCPEDGNEYERHDDHLQKPDETVTGDRHPVGRLCYDGIFNTVDELKHRSEYKAGQQADHDAVCKFDIVFLKEHERSNQRQEDNEIDNDKQMVHNINSTFLNSK